jgi:hypothetical protein
MNGVAVQRFAPLVATNRQQFLHDPKEIQKFILNHKKMQSLMMMTMMMNDDDRLRLLRCLCCCFLFRGGTEGISNFPLKWIWNPKTPENV